MCVVELPKLFPRSSLLNIDCRLEQRVMITPKSIACRSNNSRKLFRSRSKKGSLLFHSTSSATRPLKQSTLWVGDSRLSPSTTMAVANCRSSQPEFFRGLSKRSTIDERLPPATNISLRYNLKARKAAWISCHSEGQAVAKTPTAFRHSWISYRSRMSEGIKCIVDKTNLPMLR